MRNWFILDGVDSRDFGVYISGQGTFSAPGRDYNMIPVPGRNGDLVGPEKRFLNGTLTYPAFIYANFDANIEAFRNFLLSLVGYHDLVDSYHPDEIRKVLFKGPFEPNVQRRNDAGSFDITFDCKPQRFLASGQEITIFDTSGSTETYSGSIVKINNLGDANITEFSAAIEPIQSGTGDPSPDNVRPITGWTELNLVRTGANIWGSEILAESFRGAYGFTKNESTKTITFQRASTSPYHHTLCKLPFKENTRYTLIFRYSNSANNNSIRVAYTNGTYDSFSLRNTNGVKTTASITSSSSKTISEIWLGYTDIALTTVYYEESGLFEGSITGEDFESYNGETIKYAFKGYQGSFMPIQNGSGYPSPTNVRTITPGLTIARDDNTNLVVYGGVFEINTDGTGTITETIAGRYASEITWTQNQSNTHTFNGEGFTDRLLRIDADDRSDCFCDSYRWYKSTDVATQSSGAALANSSSGTLAARSRIYLSDDRFNGVAAFTASFSEYDPIFVLPLASSVTYSLTATEVLRACAALGLNYIDNGTVYAGEVDFVTGALTARPYYASYNGEALVGPWVSSMDVYAAGTSPTTGAQVVDLGGATTTVQFVPEPVELLTGINSIWTDTGDTTLTVASQQEQFTIENPTLFDSQPLLRVYGEGTLGINSQSVTITQADEYTDIDCEMMDCFKGTENKNLFVQFTDFNFPVFKPGTNNISLSGITKVEITPRWWMV